MTDTSAEAVEGYVLSLSARGYVAEAALLRALLAERDDLAEANRMLEAVAADAAQARDAARAECERMREALREVLRQCDMYDPWGGYCPIERIDSEARAALAGQEDKRDV